MPDGPGTEGGDVLLGGDTTRKCPACGGAFSGETHLDCPAAGSTIKTTQPPTGTVVMSSKSRLDDIPAEAQPFAQDPSRQLNQYLLVKQIGKGGMGAVWKAWDRKLTRWVAVKFLLAAEDEDVARFQREAKLAARLRHPNIAPIYEVGEAPSQAPGQPQRHYLAMEYIDGTSMASALGRPLRELLEIFQKVAAGVDAAHRGGVVHRDLKPQNVMLTSDGWPYVMDFGLAKALQAESSLSVSGAVMGTPAYMPPEQAQGQLDQIDAQTDVYSLGATMYAVLCKKQPFTGQTPMEILMKVCREEPPKPRSVNAELPEEIERILLKAMAKEKVDRYPTAAAVAEDLKRYLNNQPVEAQGPSSIKMARRLVKRNPWPIVAGTVALAAVAVVAVVLGSGGKPGAAAPPPPAPPPLQMPAATPDPEEEARRGKEDAQRKWQEDWLALRPRLDYNRWDAADAALGPAAGAVLRRMDAEAARRDAVDEADWLDREARRVLAESERLEKDRDRARRMVGWCDTLAAAMKDVGGLAPTAALVRQARDRAAAVADYRGSITLKIAPGPWANVVKVMRDGKPLGVPAKATPLVMSNLEIGDFELELSHPQHGTRTLKIPASLLKDGAVYVAGGLMKDAQLRLSPQ